MSATAAFSRSLPDRDRGQARVGVAGGTHMGYLGGARQQWREAADAYRYFMTTLDYLFRAQLGREHKEQWLHEARAIPAHAAYAIAELNDQKSAVTALEQGRALLLADRLERDRVDLERLADLGHADLAERYRVLTDTLRAFEHGGLETPRLAWPGKPA